MLRLLPFAAAAAADTCGALSIDGSAAVHTLAPYYASFNIDSSTDREFFMLRFDDPALLAAAAGLSTGGGSHVRFGGTGNNALTYAVPGAPPCQPKGSGHTCLNESHWRGVAGLAAAAQSPIIFGVNFFPGGKSSNATFDPTNAVQFFTWALQAGLPPIWGVENGNEINRLVTAEQQAAGLLALDDALARVYGASPRPVLIGPDALGLHSLIAPPGAIPTGVILKYLTDFVAAMKGRLRAVTHHEYIEINATNVLEPAFMDTTLQLANAVVAAVRVVSATVEVWAGEVGPHNGEGGPGDGRLGNCSGNKVCGRWGSALWYADSMASKALAGYAAYCRQDFVGADYGLLNFTTLAPAPDYWLLVLWKRLVGARVLSIATPPADPLVRAYAFCGARAPGTVAVLLVHLGTAPACVDPPGIADPTQPRLEYALTPTEGTVESPGAALNGGAPLALGAGGALPPLEGKAVPAGAPIILAPLSVTIVEIRSSVAACA